MTQLLVNANGMEASEERKTDIVVKTLQEVACVGLLGMLSGNEPEPTNQLVGIKKS
jgi:hypothetical protein